MFWVPFHLITWLLWLSSVEQYSLCPRVDHGSRSTLRLVVMPFFHSTLGLYYCTIMPGHTLQSFQLVIVVFLEHFSSQLDRHISLQQSTIIESDEQSSQTVPRPQRSSATTGESWPRNTAEEHISSPRVHIMPGNSLPKDQIWVNEFFYRKLYLPNKNSMPLIFLSLHFFKHIHHVYRFSITSSSSDNSLLSQFLCLSSIF